MQWWKRNDVVCVCTLWALGPLQKLTNSNQKITFAPFAWLYYAGAGTASVYAVPFFGGGNSTLASPTYENPHFDSDEDDNDDDNANTGSGRTPVVGSTDGRGAASDVQPEYMAAPAGGGARTGGSELYKVIAVARPEEHTYVRFLASFLCTCQHVEKASAHWAAFAVTDVAVIKLTKPRKGTNALPLEYTPQVRARHGRKLEPSVRTRQGAGPPAQPRTRRRVHPHQLLVSSCGSGFKP